MECNDLPEPIISYSFHSKRNDNYSKSYYYTEHTNKDYSVSIMVDRNLIINIININGKRYKYTRPLTEVLIDKIGNINLPIVKRTKEKTRSVELKYKLKKRCIVQCIKTSIDLEKVIYNPDKLMYKIYGSEKESEIINAFCDIKDDDECYIITIGISADNLHTTADGIVKNKDNEYVFLINKIRYNYDYTNYRMLTYENVKFKYDRLGLVEKIDYEENEKLKSIDVSYPFLRYSSFNKSTNQYEVYIYYIQFIIESISGIKYCGDKSFYIEEHASVEKGSVVEFTRNVYSLDPMDALSMMTEKEMEYSYINQTHKKGENNNEGIKNETTV